MQKFQISVIQSYEIIYFSKYSSLLSNIFMQRVIKDKMISIIKVNLKKVNFVVIIIVERTIKT